VQNGSFVNGQFKQRTSEGKPAMKRLIFTIAIILAASTAYASDNDIKDREEQQFRIEQRRQSDEIKQQNDEILRRMERQEYDRQYQQHRQSSPQYAPSQHKSIYDYTPPWERDTPK
jgi:hypothetical protein